MARIKREALLKEGRTADALAVTVLHPARDNSLVRKPLDVLQVEQSRHHTRRCRQLATMQREERGPFGLKELPVNLPR